MGKPRKHTLAPVSRRCIRSCSGDKNLPLVRVQTEDSQDLPNGWTLEVRNKRSGRAYKCYISPTGSKFYSKQQISRHLNGEPPRKSKSKKAGNGMLSTSNAVTVRRDTEELPPGWITEIKIKQVGDKIIRRDPYYTDPATGYVFRSKKDVFRYLESGEIGRLATKPKKTANLESTDEIITPPTVSKRQKLEGSATRRQLFTGQSLKLNETSKRKRILESSVSEESKSLPEHTSVESDEWPGLGSLVLVEDDDSNKTQGSKKKAVSAFPATGYSGKKQKLKKGVEEAVLALPTVVVSPKKQKQKLQDAGSNERQGPKLRSRRVIVPASPAARDSPEKQQQQLQKGVEKVGTAPPTVVVSPKKQQRKLEGANLHEMPGPRLRSRKETALTPPAAVAPPEKQQLVKRAGKVVSVLPTVVVTSEKQQQKVEDADSNRTQESKRRARKEIVSALPAAGVTPEKLQLKKMEKVVPAQPTVEVSPNKQQPKLENGVGKRGNRKTQLSSSRSKDEKKLNFPHRVSKRLAGVSADPAPELVVTRKRKSLVSAGVEDNKQGLEQIDQGGSSPEGNLNLTASEGAKAPSVGGETILNKGGDPLQTDEKSNQCDKPLADQSEASEPQRTEEVNQKPESSLDMPFGDTWPDPCLEFAFKTLTGAIPVEENLVIQDYFQPQLSSDPTLNTSDLALPDTSIDAFCQTDGLLRFDSMERPASPPKFQENKTVFPASTSSGNIINFGENGLQHSTSHENILSFGGNAKQQPSTRGTNAKDR